MMGAGCFKYLLLLEKHYSSESFITPHICEVRGNRARWQWEAGY